MAHDTNDLLATYALDAVDREDQERIERHVVECPRCQSELDAYREVAASIGNSVAQVPTDLWNAISSQLQDRRGGAIPPTPTLLRQGFEHGQTSGAALAPTRVPSSRWRKSAYSALAIAAASIIAVLGLSLSNANTQNAQLRGAAGESAHTDVVTALETPGHKLVNLTSKSSEGSAQFVLLPDGRGYLVKSTLPSLSANMTYQLWGVVDGQPISLGLLGQSPHQVTFTLAGAPGPSELGINVEPAGGAVVPSAPMRVEGVT